MKNSRECRRESKRVFKEIGVRNRRFKDLVCIKCGRVIRVRVSNKSDYSEERVSRWVCLLCRERGVRLNDRVKVSEYR